MTPIDAPEPINLLEALSEYQDFHTAIFLTYCADLAFFEAAVLHRLWQNGCRNIAVFMDAQRYADTLNDMRDSIKWVGRRYVVCPVRLENQRAFHPKLALLIGPERGRLMIGSGNLTFTGWGHNHEVYSCLDWTSVEPDLQSLFAQAWAFIQQIDKRWGHSPQIKTMLQKAIRIAPWLNHQTSSPDDIQLLHTLEGPIVQQLSQLLAKEVVHKLVVVTPFLDNDAAAIETLYRQFSPQQLHLILQPGKAVGNPEALLKLREQIPLQIYSYTEPERYLHAKIVTFETETASYILSGSPNCTRAALLLPPEHGNIEVALLRLGETSRQFDYVLKDRITLSPLQDLNALTLQAGRLTSDQAISSAIQVLDATVTNEMLNVRYRVVHLPEDITTLQTRITSTPPIYNPLKESAEGEQSAQFRLTQAHAVLQARPLSVSIGGQGPNQTWIDLGCNELWVTNADELHAQMMNTAVVSIGSGNCLAEGVVASDQEWGELYKTLAELIELDLAGLKTKGGTYTTTVEMPPLPPQPEEGETVIHMIGAEELARERAYTEAIDIERALFDESRFNAWLEYVSGRLSGVNSELIEPGENDNEDARDASKQKGRPEPLRVRHRPNPRLERRFVNLVRKYIGSLHNVAYMQSVSILHILTYFTVFQRIIWLLFEHEIIDQDEFARLILEMNAGFFGAWNESAPLCTPRLYRHIRRVWQTEWQKYEVGQYALASMELALHWIEQSEVTGGAKLQAAWQMVRLLTGIALVMNVKLLAEDTEAWAQVAKVYHQDEEEFRTQIRERITHSWSDALSLLQRWNLLVNVDTLAATDPNSAEYLRREQLDYHLAEYHIRKQLGETDTLLELCSASLSKAQQFGDLEIAIALEEDYIDLAEAAGQFKEVAQTLYKQGERLCRDKQFIEAYDKLQRALAISQSIEDSTLIASCRRVLRRIEFFLS